MARKSQLTARQSKAIRALVSIGSISHAADESGVSRRTLHRWLQEPHFRECFLRARADALQEAISVCAARAVSAVERLAVEMDNPRGSPSSRIAAAREILGLTFGTGAMMDFEERIGALEARINERIQTAQRKT